MSCFLLPSYIATIILVIPPHCHQHEWEGSEALQPLLPQWGARRILQVKFRTHVMALEFDIYLPIFKVDFVQLSQLEDPGRAHCDLPCAAQVRLQTVRRQWGQGSHPQVRNLAEDLI